MSILDFVTIHEQTQNFFIVFVLCPLVVFPFVVWLTKISESAMTLTQKILAACGVRESVDAATIPLPLLTLLASVASAAEEFLAFAHDHSCQMGDYEYRRETALREALERLRAEIGGRDD